MKTCRRNILTLIFIGMLGFIVLALLNIIFAIIAAVKANDGELWAYPLSIKFLKYQDRRCIRVEM